MIKDIAKDILADAGKTALQNFINKSKANNLPDENKYFTGRKEALEQIAAAFENNNKFAITGSSGFGKHDYPTNS